MRRLIKGLLIGTLTGLVGILLGLTPYGADFERNVGLPWLFKIRGELPTPDEVAIVAIDDRTGDHGVSTIQFELVKERRQRPVIFLRPIAVGIVVALSTLQLHSHEQRRQRAGRTVSMGERSFNGLTLTGGWWEKTSFFGDYYHAFRQHPRHIFHPDQVP